MTPTPLIMIVSVAVLFIVATLFVASARRSHAKSTIHPAGTLHMQNDKFIPHILEFVNQGKTVTIVARGNSMRPFIEDSRDRLVFGKADIVKTGDVILAEISPGHYVCHRVEYIDATRVVMRGDGNVPCKALGYRGIEEFTPAEIRAKLVKVIRKNKTYDTSQSRIWRIYSNIWPRLLPMRRILLALYRLVWLGQLPHIR